MSLDDLFKAITALPVSTKHIDEAIKNIKDVEPKVTEREILSRIYSI